MLDFEVDGLDEQYWNMRLAAMSVQSPVTDVIIGDSWISGS